MFDWKKIVGALLSLGLAAGLGFAAKQGVEVKCPEQGSPAVQGQNK